MSHSLQPQAGFPSRTCLLPCRLGGAFWEGYWRTWGRGCGGEGGRRFCLSPCPHPGCSFSLSLRAAPPEPGLVLAACFRTGALTWCQGPGEAHKVLDGFPFHARRFFQVR